MKHLGDIRNIDGSAIEVPDIVCGGSPCQDLSVAGKRAGFEGERSGLFYEYIRVVKELRESSARNLRTTNTGLIKPRYMVLENVPGLYSSNEGYDFQACLTEIVRIVQPDAPDVPKPDRGGVEQVRMALWNGSKRMPVLRGLENARRAVLERTAEKKTGLRSCRFCGTHSTENLV